jgi:starvation-inducible outer membrane lipoprotein
MRSATKVPKVKPAMSAIIKASVRLGGVIISIDTIKTTAIHDL